jgi:2-dehydropantoate 2-reductase
MNDQSYPQLRVLCFGAGAIGAYIGGSLALAGQSVVFLERPEMTALLSTQGIYLRTPGLERHLQTPEIVSSIDEALTKGPFDVAIVAVKSFDTENLLETIKPYAAALPVIACFQNGVENEEKLANALGTHKIIHGSVTTAVGKTDFNHIRVEKLRGISLASDHSITPALVSALNSAGLNAHQLYDAEGMKWSKMLTNIMGNATSAILQMTPGEVFSNPLAYHIEVLQLREALAVMDKAQFPVMDLPAVPVKILMATIKHLPEALSRVIVAGSVGKGRGDKLPSFYLDLAAGRPQSEVDYLNGAIVRFAERYQMQAPVNRVLTRILEDIVHGKQAWETYQHNPQKLMQEIIKETI